MPISGTQHVQVDMPVHGPDQAMRLCSTAICIITQHQRQLYLWMDGS
jgi:hypothetical protein